MNYVKRFFNTLLEILSATMQSIIDGFSEIKQNKSLYSAKFWKICGISILGTGFTVFIFKAMAFPGQHEMGKRLYYGMFAIIAFVVGACIACYFEAREKRFQAIKQEIVSEK